MGSAALRTVARRVRWLANEVGRYPRGWLRAARRPETFSVHGVKLATYILPAGARDSLYRERYERGEVRLFLAKYDQDDVVMEIGAGIGFVSTLCARILGSERVFSYEANPALRPVAEATYELNGVAPTLTSGLLAATDGTARFFVDDDFLCSSVIAKQGAQEVEVPQLAVQAEIDRIRPTFIIMDIEGAEAELVPLIDWSGVEKAVLELHPDVIGESGARAIEAHLAAAGLHRDRGLSTSNKVYYERG